MSDKKFKGFWIPVEIFQSENLTWMEKMFLSEIVSLDENNECFASNKFFADFFNLRITRTSQIINSLIKKGCITAKHIRKGNKFVKRILMQTNKDFLHKSVRGSYTNVYEVLTQKCKKYPEKKVINPYLSKDYNENKSPISTSTNTDIKRKNTPCFPCQTYTRLVKNYKGNSVIKTWCKLFKPICDKDDKFCMAHCNQLYVRLQSEFKSKGLDIKSPAFFGAFRNKVNQMLGDPDSTIFKDLKNRYKKMPNFMEDIFNESNR